MKRIVLEIKHKEVPCIHFTESIWCSHLFSILHTSSLPSPHCPATDLLIRDFRHGHVLLDELRPGHVLRVLRIVIPVDEEIEQVLIGDAQQVAASASR